MVVNAALVSTTMDDPFINPRCKREGYGICFVIWSFCPSIELQRHQRSLLRPGKVMSMISTTIESYGQHFAVFC